jgi:putative chitinase
VAGDGRRFKGRGLIQITGRSNYTELANDLGIDCLNNPPLLGARNITLCNADQLSNAAFCAGWFWNKRVINELADRIELTKPIDTGQNKENFIRITRRINGGTNGLQDRFNRYKKGQPFF